LAKWQKHRVTDDDVEAFLGVIKELDQRRRNLLALMLFAVSRRDRRLCDALDELYQASPSTRRPVDKPVEEIDGSLLRRLGRVCPHDERIWWERALAHAEEEGDEFMRQGLVKLIERRMAS
jgi:hypothetical protein